MDLHKTENLTPSYKMNLDFGAVLKRKYTRLITDKACVIQCLRKKMLFTLSGVVKDFFVRAKKSEKQTQDREFVTVSWNIHSTVTPYYCCNKRT